MFAAVVLFDEMFVHFGGVAQDISAFQLGGGGDAYRDGGHFGDLLQHDGIVDGVEAVGAPGEGTVVAYQHGGGVHGVHPHEALDYYVAGFLLVFAPDLGLAHAAGAGDVLVEVIGVGGADVGDVEAGLGPGGGVGGMGVHHAADGGKSLVEHEVCGGVGGRAQGAFDDVAVEVDDDHVGGLHAVVGHAAGLDDHKAAPAVDGAHVAPGEYHQAVLHQVEVGLADLLFKLFQHNGRGLPEVDVEGYGECQDNGGVDDVPLVPGGACDGLLLGGGGAEAQALDLFGGGLGSEQRNDYRQYDAEEEHPDAEGIDVHLVEDVGEDIVGVGVDDHGDEAGEAEHQTDDESPHAGLGRGLLPGDAEQEGGGDGGSEKALDALDVVVQALAHALDDENPQHAEHDYHDGGDTADGDELLLVGFGVLALVDVDGVEHCRGVVERGQRAHEGCQDAADHHSLEAHGQQGVDQHGECDVGIGDGAVGTDAECGGEGLADGGVGGLGEGEGNHAGDEEQEHGKELEVGSEDGAPAGLLLVLAGKDPLDDELVCAPVPEADDGRSEQGAVPGEFAVLAAAHEGGHAVAVFVDALGAADCHHVVPAAELLEAEPEYDQRAEQQDGRLEDGGLEDGLHAADDGVDGGDDDEREGRHPEVDAQEGVEGKAACKDGHRDLGEDIARQGEPCEDAAALLVVSFLEELGHGVDHAPLIEGDEYPAQDEDHPALYLPVGLGHAGRGAGACKADEVFRSDV